VAVHRPTDRHTPDHYCTRTTTPWLKKTSHLWLAILAIVFTYTARLQYFLAQMLPRKYEIKLYFICQPRITSASALPGETRNQEIASFHLNAACFFTKKTRNTVKNITWLELKHPSLSKLSTGCTRQDLGREHRILLSFTYILCVNQVCHGVSHCVKDWSCSSSSLK